MNLSTFQTLIYNFISVFKFLNSYWFHHTDGKKGPFCKHCYELRGILSYIDNHKELCSTCGASVKKNTDPTLIKKNNCKKIIPFPQNVTN